MQTKHFAAVAVIAALAASFLSPVIRPAQAVTRESTTFRFLTALNGRPTYLGRISATTTAKNNADATAFTIPQDAKLLLVCADAAVRILPDTDVTEDITTANGVPVAGSFNPCFWVTLNATDNYLQAITASGTANVDVWRLD